jgi:2-phosphosulfolactate phosphatase
MRVDVVLLPSLLTEAQTAGRAVVVFDVLRATTTMAAALAVGVSAIYVYRSTAAARDAAGPASDARLLCGEERCLPPAGFDLGNSPGAFTASHRGRILHMSTTNGTRAIVAARRAGAIYPAAIVNAGAAAGALLRQPRDVTLLCAGTDGTLALEDVLGAGAVLDALETARADVTHESDGPALALHLFRSLRGDLPAALASTRGGRNVAAAGLAADVDFAGRLDALDVVGVIDDPAADPPVVRRLVP